jgi:hypothetical protein
MHRLLRVQLCRLALVGCYEFCASRFIKPHGCRRIRRHGQDRVCDKTSLQCRRECGLPALSRQRVERHRRIADAHKPWPGETIRTVWRRIVARDKPYWFTVDVLC